MIDPPRQRPRPRLAYCFAGLVVVALIVRIAVVIATPDYQARTDAADFDRLAVSLADHGRFPSSAEWAPRGPTAFRPPLFPVALAAVYTVVGTGSEHTRWEAGRVMEAALGALAVGLIFLIGWRLWGPAVGLVAGGIAAVYPPLVLVGTSLLSESLFIPLVLGAVLAALLHRDSAHRWRWAVLAGVLTGLAALTRGNGFVLAIPLAFLVWEHRSPPRRPGLRAPLAVVLATILTVVPWTIRNYSVFHQFVPTTTEPGYALAGTYNAADQYRKVFPALWYPPLDQMRAVAAAHPDANEAQVSSRLTSIGLHYIEHHPGSLLRTGYLSALRLFNLQGPTLEEVFSFGEGYPLRLAQYSVYAFWLLLGLAVAGALTRGARRVPAALWGVPAIILLSTLFLEGLTRYRSPADPFFVLLAALALVSLAGRLRASRSHPPVNASAAGMIKNGSAGER